MDDESLVSPDPATWSLQVAILLQVYLSRRYIDVLWPNGDVEHRNEPLRRIASCWMLIMTYHVVIPELSKITIEISKRCWFHGLYVDRPWIRVRAGWIGNDEDIRISVLELIEMERESLRFSYDISQYIYSSKKPGEFRFFHQAESVPSAFLVRELSSWAKSRLVNACSYGHLLAMTW